MPAPYSNTWDETTPLGTEDANKIDDFLRQLHLDIQERMLDITVWPTEQSDPANDVDVTLLQSAVDDAVAFTDAELLVDWSSGTPKTSTESWLYAVGSKISPVAISGNLRWIMPIRLPIGAKLTDYKIVCDPGVSPATIGFNLAKTDLGTGVAAALGSGASAGDVLQNVQLPAPIDEDIVLGFTYWAEIVIVNSNVAIDSFFFAGGPIYDSPGASVRI